MKKIESGNVITVNYTGKFEDGTVFDSSLSKGREPLHTVLGSGNLIPGFEKGLLGMEVGESKTIEIDPTEAYGEYLDGLVNVVPPTQMPEGVKVGDVLQSSSDRGTINVTVKEINENKVPASKSRPPPDEAARLGGPRLGGPLEGGPRDGGPLRDGGPNTLQGVKAKTPTWLCDVS